MSSALREVAIRVGGLLLADVEGRGSLEVKSRQSIVPANAASELQTYLDPVPVLAGEGVLGLLLEALLAL